MVTGQQREVAQQVHAGRGHCSTKTHQEVIGLEQEGSGAVFADIF